MLPSASGYHPCAPDAIRRAPLRSHASASTGLAPSTITTARVLPIGVTKCERYITEKTSLCYRKTTSPSVHSGTERWPESHSKRILGQDRYRNGHHHGRRHRRLKFLRLERKAISKCTGREEKVGKRKTHIDMGAGQPARVLPRARRLP